MCISASACAEEFMGPIIMLLICVALMAYLVYAMLRPEKF
jgi:K+-transporting ATPase KdpF subunit